MPSTYGWNASEIGNAQRHFGDSGNHTLVTFPKSQKSITIEWQKTAIRTEVGYHFQDDEKIQGIFFYDGSRLKMTYEYSYYRLSFGGKETQNHIQCQERENIPCMYLILGIIYQKPEIQELPAHEDEPVWSINISRGYMDEPGDRHDTITSSSIRYEFNLADMSCAYSYRYYGDFEQ